MTGIYAIRNKNNDKVYIGSAVDIHPRWWRHKSLLRSNKHSNKHLQNAWNKDGEDAFEWIILEEVPDKMMIIEREQYHMDSTLCYNSEHGYNFCKKAGSILGVKRSQETKDKMAASRTGKRHTEETKQRMSLLKQGSKHWNYGKTLSLSTKSKIDIANSGPNHGMYGKISSLNTQSKPIIQLDLMRNSIKEWACSADIHRKLGFNRSNINACCRGGRKKAHGFKWEFKT